MFLEKLDWIKDLVLEEQEKEQKGVIDVSFEVKSSPDLKRASEVMLAKLKKSFIDASHTYNSLRQDQPSKIKVYGISNTAYDFMLFRNNIQLIFSLKEPGIIQVYSSQLSMAIFEASDEEKTVKSLSHLLRAKVGTFDVHWTFKNETFNMNSLIKYYFTLFIRISANH